MEISDREILCFRIGGKFLLGGILASIIALAILEGGLMEKPPTFLVVALNIPLIVGMFSGIYLWVKGFEKLDAIASKPIARFMYISFNVTAAFWLYWQLLNNGATRS